MYSKQEENVIRRSNGMDRNERPNADIVRITKEKKNKIKTAIYAWEGKIRRRDIHKTKAKELETLLGNRYLDGRHWISTIH